MEERVAGLRLTDVVQRLVEILVELVDTGELERGRERFEREGGRDSRERGRERFKREGGRDSREREGEIQERERQGETRERGEEKHTLPVAIFMEMVLNSFLTSEPTVGWFCSDLHRPRPCS